MKKLSLDLKSFLQVVREFFRALGQGRTYNITKNWYCFFGILWGIPVPFVTIGIDLYSSAISPTVQNVMQIITLHPFHFFFILHPLLFGIVFGAMGTVRYNKEQKIQELDKLKSNFLSMVSHELRTPLTTIQGYISFLRSQKPGELNQKQEECLKISEEETEHLNRLIEDLLDLSRIEIGAFKVNLKSVDMKEVINKAIFALQIFADNQKVILENNLPNDLPNVYADKERLFQVVTNLIENSIKFNRRGGKTSINAFIPGKNNKITFCITDTGIGIPEDSLDKIFDKFYQVDSSQKRKYAGCGLGLAIAKRILELHQGKIWVESKIEEGSKFFFEIPTYSLKNNPL
ncbi:MAG: HAMP domain-containing sensor histidine kinase [Candidatus Omnitrophota bacterium]|nr:HAMP domain-containing sensor histidine kinase [Candidatus Omnitrophota bacterium]